MSAKLPVVAVVGRPNVGKSTFFNRVVGRRVAIVDDQPGVTRDRNFARADWAGRAFYIVDTGGVVEGSDLPMDRAVRQQALIAAEEADLILFLVDGKEGVHPLDQRLLEILRKSKRPVLLAVNKQDNLPRDTGHNEFWELGLGEPVPVSAMTGKGSGDLLDAIIERLPPVLDEDLEADEIRVAVVGKPNVGKSSFVNRIFGEERVVVTDQAGTTRDPVDTPLQYHGQTLVFVDTAGLRRHSKIHDSVEYYSSLRTARMVRAADICLVLVDATEGLSVQDLRVAESAWDAGAGVILVLNKWDLVDKDTHTAPAFEKKIRERAPFLRWVPVLFTSALSGQRVRKSLDLILQVQETRNTRIATAEVNRVLERATIHQHPPHYRGRPINIKYGTQVGVAPPTFALFVNHPKAVPEHYVRYLHNSFRSAWGFLGAPVRIRLRDSSS